MVRIYIQKNPCFTDENYDNDDQSEKKWEGYSVEHGRWATSSTRAGVVKLICRSIRKYSLCNKIDLVKYGEHYNNHPERSILVIYKNAAPWRTFRFSGVTAKVRIAKKPQYPK